MDFLEVVTESKSAKKKQILIDLKESVDFVNAYKKGKPKAKSLKQLLTLAQASRLCLTQLV